MCEEIFKEGLLTEFIRKDLELLQASFIKLDTNEFICKSICAIPVNPFNCEKHCPTFQTQNFPYKEDSLRCFCSQTFYINDMKERDSRLNPSH